MVRETLRSGNGEFDPVLAKSAAWTAVPRVLLNLDETITKA